MKNLRVFAPARELFSEQMNVEKSNGRPHARVIAASLAALGLSVRLAYGPRTVDDAFISFRYARNIAEGVGFVFNDGERVLGTTTPLFTLLLSVFYLSLECPVLDWGKAI